MARTQLKQPQIGLDASNASVGSSGSASGTGTALTASYTFTAGRKYLISILSSNPNSAGIWQFSYSVSGGGAQTGLNHGRFGGASGEQVMFNFTNIFTPSTSGNQTITVTATLVTSGGANWDDICVQVIPLLN